MTVFSKQTSGSDLAGRCLAQGMLYAWSRLKILPRWKNDKPGELPELPSVSGLWSTADWHEREVYDLSGVYFTDHPNMRRILCPEDWVGHPLRKDYEMPLEYHGIRGR